MTEPTRRICLGVPPATCGRPATELVYDPALRRTTWFCADCACDARDRILLHSQHPIRNLRRSS